MSDGHQFRFPLDLAAELREDLSPLGHDCVIPQGLQSDSIFDESRGKILGLVAATVVSNAVTVPPLQSGNVDSQCNAASQQSQTPIPGGKPPKGIRK